MSNIATNHTGPIPRMRGYSCQKLCQVRGSVIPVTLAGTWSADGTASCSGNVCTLSGLHTRKVLSVTFTESITGNGEAIVINQP